MPTRPARVFPPLIFLLACGPNAPPPLPAPPPAPTFTGREPTSPPGTEGLRPRPCTRATDLSQGSADTRAFGPGARAISGKTTIAFRTTARTRSWSSSRPQALSFLDDAPDHITLVAGEPGATLLELTTEAEQASALVSVPLFVHVRVDRAFSPMVRREFNLGGHEREIMVHAKQVLETIYARVNLRFVFSSYLDETLPEALPRLEATIHGDLHKCVTPQSSILYTEFGGYAEGTPWERLVRAPIHVCPAIFTKHPDALAEMTRHRDKLLSNEHGTEVFVAALGRAMGELLAHELGHQLLGCDTRRARGWVRCHDLRPHSLMNKAGERSFADRTGIFVRPTAYSSEYRDDFPEPGSYEDRGIDAINKLPADGQEVLSRILPVPPELREEVPCGAR